MINTRPGLRKQCIKQLTELTQCSSQEITKHSYDELFDLFGELGPSLEAVRGASCSTARA